jgi:hypothetical protein
MHMLSHLKMQHIHLLSNNTLAVSSKGTTLGLICSSPPCTSFFPAGDPSADAPTGRKPPGHHVGPDFQTAAITMLAEGDPTRKSLTLTSQALRHMLPAPKQTVFWPTVHLPAAVTRCTCSRISKCNTFICSATTH